MAFEIFVKSAGKGRRSAEPMISIRKNGALGINQSASEQWFKDRAYVLLMFDTESGRVGMRPLSEPHEHGFKLQSLKNSQHVQAGRFLNHWNIPHPKTQAYPAVWDEANGVVVFQPERVKEGVS